MTAFNTLSLVKDPEAIFNKLNSYVKKNCGLLIVKDSALSSDFYWPIDAKVRETISRVLCTGGHINGYDPDFALTCRKFLKRSGFTISETRLNSYSFMYPFGAEQRTYICQNARMIQELTPDNITFNVLDVWIDTEMSEENGHFFSNSESIYTTTEFTYICHTK